ncbi:YceI family protein [Salinifilum ghardaiensis]
MALGRLLRRRSKRSGGSGRAERAGSILPPTPLDSGILSGQVHDDEEKLLPGVTVTVANRLNQQVAQCTTDTYGYFVTALPPGEHRVAISAGGYQRLAKRCEIRVNQHTTLGGVQLEQDPALELPEPGVWKFDPYHTEIRFTAQHIGMSQIHGMFSSFDGRIIVGPRVEDSRVEVVIDAASVDTGVSMRDDHLRSADFFDVENHPRLYFSSDRLTPLRGNQWSVHGQLTLRGHSSPVDLNAVYLGQRRFPGPGFDNDLRVGAHATTTLRREDYAVNWQATLAKGIAVVGPTIEVELGVQAVKES